MVNPISAMQTFNKYGKYFLIAVFLVNFMGLAFADNAGTENILTAMEELCNSARGILAIGVMLMVIMAAVVYAVGQILGAETRARASVWATAMITGAVIGIIIYIIVPAIIGIMIEGTAHTGDPCDFDINE
jgi:hypothetical protein